MSDLFDDEPGDVETRRPGSRARALVITGVVLVLAFFALTTFASIYTDRLWYDEVGYGQVFSTMLWTRIGLFLVFGLFMAAAVAVNMYLAYRFRPLFRIPGGDGSVDRYRDAVTPIRTWLLVGVAVVVGMFAGTSALGNWRTYLLWRHAQPFGQDDAYFNKDISFYVFRLPWWHYVVDFTMAVAVVAIIATAVVHYLYGGIRLQVQHDRLSGAAQVQLSVLLGVFVLAKGVDYYLDRFDLVTNDNHLFTGMNYTGENALLPARNILMGVALICAVLFFLNIWRRTWQLPSVGLALLVLSAILLGMIWPAIVQNFQVKPTEADKEEKYIQENIDSTRDGLRHRWCAADGLRRRPTGGPRRPRTARPARRDSGGGPEAGLRDVRTASAAPPLLLGVLGARRRPVHDREPRDGGGGRDAARSRRARARSVRHRRLRPELVQPAHRLHPRRGRRGGVRQRCLGRREQRPDRVGRGHPGLRERVVARPSSRTGSTTASRARTTPWSARRRRTRTTSS